MCVHLPVYVASLCMCIAYEFACQVSPSCLLGSPFLVPWVGRFSRLNKNRKNEPLLRELASLRPGLGSLPALPLATPRRISVKVASQAMQELAAESGSHVTAPSNGASARPRSAGFKRSQPMGRGGGIYFPKEPLWGGFEAQPRNLRLSRINTGCFFP